MKTLNNSIYDIDNINTDQNQENNDFYFGYDSIEDIKKCLNCDKPKCTNCLYWKNGV